MTRLERERPDSLSVPEMLRIMDVATALRQDRELVEEQLNVEELKKRLKERMIEAAKVTGESVTPEEVDAAIRQYYASLYSFREPKLGVEAALAHLWVRRVELLWMAGAALVAVSLFWGAFLSPRAPMTAQGRNLRRVESLSASVTRLGDDVRALAKDKAVTSEVAELTSEADVYLKKGDAAGLDAVRKNLVELEKHLGEAYTINVVSGANHRSAARRDYSDHEGKRLAGYYLIVEARAPDGTVLKRRIHDDESDTYKEVTTWAERVPEAVYERLKKDKLKNGTLNETAFAVKRKGVADEEITMPGPDGKPLARLGRITKW
jgi:hypothetical protein